MRTFSCAEFVVFPRTSESSVIFEERAQVFVLIFEPLFQREFIEFGRKHSTIQLLLWVRQLLLHVSRKVRVCGTQSFSRHGCRWSVDPSRNPSMAPGKQMAWNTRNRKNTKTLGVVGYRSMWARTWISSNWKMFTDHMVLTCLLSFSPSLLLHPFHSIFTYGH